MRRTGLRRSLTALVLVALAALGLWAHAQPGLVMATLWSLCGG
jgi:hypothetical protein